jgi:hypothetical protein
MTRAVEIGAFAVAAANALPALLGGWRWYRGGTSRGFWVLLRVGQGAAVLFAFAVGALTLAGRNSADRLFYLYALLPLAVAFVAEQLRLSAAQAVLDQRGLEDAQAVGELPEAEQRRVVAAILRREMGVMALSALVVAFLAVGARGPAPGLVSGGAAGSDRRRREPGASRPRGRRPRVVRQFGSRASACPSQCKVP